MRSSSIGFGGCGGGASGGGGFWSRLKRLRLTFTSNQQKKIAANASEARESGNTIRPKYTPDSGADIHRRDFVRLLQPQGATKRSKSLHRMASSLERSSTLSMLQKFEILWLSKLQQAGRSKVFEAKNALGL